MKIIDQSVYTFSKDNPPFCTAAPGDSGIFNNINEFL